MPQLAGKVMTEAARFVGVVLRYHANPVSAAQRYWSLYQERRFSPNEIHFQRLLDPRLSVRDLEDAVSKEELLAVQNKLNPRELHPRTEDKVCFHEFSVRARLPVPRIFALIDRTGSSGPELVPVLRNVEGVDAFLREPATDTLILKPVDGVHGEGVMRLDRNGREWRDIDSGDACNAAVLIDRIDRSPYDRWIFQEVVESHPELRALSDTTACQTIRVVTLIDERNEVRIIATRLRLICGNVATDNFNFGKTGNVIALLDPSDGAIRAAVGSSINRHEICPVTHHPRTGRLLVGFRVPEWEAVRKLAVDAANAFRPLRSIGWDVAVTPGSPRLIEGNVTWDTLTGDPQMGAIYRYLRELAFLTAGDA